ncbi:MAG TPA: HlyD family efflux transporter periplasmic adaptor subunit [Pirellulales bacterium]|nr:HlyD family efflux transporter periplasmic adaptor subunit [Pirellulales bacterium]
MRPDLVVVPQSVAGRRSWAIKDPVALAYFRLRDEELAVLEMLDGRASAAEIMARFEQRFAPRRLTPEGLQGFLARLHRDGLIVSAAAGQGTQLLDRAGASLRRRRLASVTNLLSIRLPGINPTRFLEYLQPLAALFFSRTALLAGASLAIAMLAVMATHVARFAARLPDWQNYLTPRNAVLAVAAISLVKVLHEFGHALACRRFGGECTEIGPMFLVFAPCLYCDVSDSWMFASKWRRAAVAAAGIYVEVVLAAMAAALWWSSEPGLFKALCFNVMLVGSINTLLFNGNPLLRYDGYYVLSDLIEIPNLAEQSSTALRTLAARVLLGQRSRTRSEWTGWRYVFLLAYGVAATAYRFVLVALLLWFCYRALLPYRLETLAVALGASVLGGMIASPLARGWRFARTPTVGPKVPAARLFAVGVLTLSLLAALVLVPLPVRVTAPVVIEPQDAQRVYVSEAGTLQFAVAAGQAVQAGETLARLTNPDLDLELARLTGERNQQRSRLANLERRRGQDRAAAAEIPTAREALADVEERLAKRTADRERLVLRAPIAGTVLPPEWNAQPVLPESLPTWRGTPMLARNQGAFLEVGTLFCLIGDPQRVEAVATVDQADIDRLAVGERVDIKVDQAAGTILLGTVKEVAEVDVDIAPRRLAKTGELATRTDSTGIARPLSASYQVRIVLDTTDRTVLLGAPGRVRIHCPAESVVARVRRWLRGSFHFSV